MDQIYIGEFPSKGLTKNPLPFNIDNNAFPTLFNFYSWRGRAKRKRGTALLGQLERQLEIAAVPNNWQVASFNLVGGAGNLISQYSLGSGASITPGSISLVIGGQTYTDLNEDGTLQGSGGGTGTINYATGAFTITGGGVSTVTGTFSYFPGLPVMGLRDLNITASLYPLLLAFDTKYAYQINQSTSPPFFYSVSYYKGTNNPVVWSGQDYQLFWSTNYQGAFWATNDKPGLNFVNGTYTSGSGTPNITFNFKSGGVDFTTLIVGDQLWFNEWTSGGSTINGLMGTVSDATGAASGNYVVTFTGNQTVAGTGIAQLLTNSIPGQDGIKWYDGDPTGGTGLPTGTGKGWVNFAPPLTATTVSINNLPIALYYLVGALAIVPFKDRLLFFAPYIQTSSGAPILLQDTVIWSWNGTAYYTTPVPDNQTSDVSAYYVDQTGKGGFLSAGLEQAIVCINNNEDVLLVSFTQKQTRFVYTGNDLYPFLFFIINSELGASSTFSGITLDRGGITVGRRGIVLTTQQSAERIDLVIPDDVFEIQALNNGAQRVNAIRDYFREWMYFAYPIDNSLWKFPTQTLLWNYRDNTWAIFYENFTAHGTFRQQNKNTWATIGLKFPTWSAWNESWNSGSTNALSPEIIGGNPQGYVLIKDRGTQEGASGTISAIADDGLGNTQITSQNHCVKVGDYINVVGINYYELTATITNISNSTQAVVTAANSFIAGRYTRISGVSGMTQINDQYVLIVQAYADHFIIDLDTTNYTPYASGGTATLFPYDNQIGKVISTPNANSFILDLSFSSFSYIGLGQYQRMSQPLIQTKEFPFYWNEGRQVRLGNQKYLLDRTVTGQVTLNIYLSQDSQTPWNDPFVNTDNLPYSQVLYTCPESSNLGLSPPNTNLQMPTAANQFQIWHRVNTSLIGDTFQVGITLSDKQMRNLSNATDEISLHGIVLTVDKGPHLA